MCTKHFPPLRVAELAEERGCFKFLLNTSVVIYQIFNFFLRWKNSQSLKKNKLIKLFQDMGAIPIPLRPEAVLKQLFLAW